MARPSPDFQFPAAIKFAAFEMTDAARTSSASPEDVAALIAYFESAATMLVNRFDAPVPTSASELHVLQQLDPGTPPPGLEPTS